MGKKAVEVNVLGSGKGSQQVEVSHCATVRSTLKTLDVALAAGDTVRVNGQEVRMNARLKAGDKVEVVRAVKGG